MWNPQIPKHEVENVIDVFWYMLQELDMSKHDETTQLLINNAYDLLNRCGISDARPRIQDN